MAGKFQALKIIQNLTPQELSECLTLNGYQECCQLITSQNVDGDTFLNLTEFQLKTWKMHLSPVHSSRLWSFLCRIKEYPEEFVLQEKKNPQISKKQFSLQKESKTPFGLQKESKTPFGQQIISKTVENKKEAPKKLKKKSVEELAKALSCQLRQVSVKQELSKDEEEEEQLYENNENVRQQHNLGNSDDDNDNFYSNVQTEQAPSKLVKKISAKFPEIKNKSVTLTKRESEAQFKQSSSNLSSVKTTGINSPVKEPDYPRLKKQSSGRNTPVKEPDYPKLKKQSSGRNTPVKEPDYPKLKEQSNSHNPEAKKEPDYPRPKTSERKTTPPLIKKDSDCPRIKAITPPNLSAILGGDKPPLPVAPPLLSIGKLKPKLPMPPAISSHTFEDEPPEYTSCEEEFDDDYLLPNEIAPIEENYYEAEPPSFIKNRPLPPPPSEPKRFIEIIIEEQEQEKRRKELLDLKHKIDEEEATNSLKRQSKKRDLPGTPLKSPKAPELGPRPNFGRDKSPLPKPPIHMVGLNMKLPEQEKQTYISSLESQPFYRNIDRKGANMLLSDLEDGAFVLRPSSKFYCTLSIKFENRIYNIGIIKSSDNLLRCNSETAGQTFKNAQELTQFYMKNPLQCYSPQKELVNIILKDLVPLDNY